MPLILFNKPFRVLSQFTDPQGRAVLADYVSDPRVYPAGRLDYDSEGLLLLTDDGALQARISDPGRGVRKHYWVQVEGEVEPGMLQRLRDNVALKDGPAIAREAMCIPEPAGLWGRVPPVRERQHIPTAWLEIAIDEGRNRQVRRMTAAVGLPTLRLIRHKIGPWSLDSLQPGECSRFGNRDAGRLLAGWIQEPLA